MASFDIDWYPEATEFFRFIHENDVQASAAILDRVLDQTSSKIHGETKKSAEPELLDAYIQEKVFGKVREFESLMPVKFSVSPEIEINGRSYANLNSIMKRIQADPAIMASLGEIETCEIHGDLTIDNIIVGDGGFKILDPNNENAVSDPIVDFAKLYQSLHSGYEHLVGLTKMEAGAGSISFEERITAKYQELFEHLNLRLKERLTPARLTNVKFHEAVHYARMLPYRARINPQTAPAFYAVMVRLFNEFLEESQGSAKR